MTIPLDAENLFAETVTIPAGASKADAVWTQGRALVGIIMPAGWDAAQVGFEIGVAATGTFVTAVDNTGNYEQAKGAASVAITFPTTDALFGPYLIAKSVDASNAAVNQSAARTLTLILRRLLGGS